MSLIKCPECGKEISDKATSCPNCGCPISEIKNEGIVHIKVGVLHAPTGLNGKQKVEISIDNKIVWEGNTGEIAELHIDKPTNIYIHYCLSLMHYGGDCSGEIDPSKYKKYSVSARQGIMSTKLVLQPVDVFDSD